jgi:inner membrane protein
VTLRSAWPHPSFYGRYMPESRVGEDGFSATWRTSFFSTNARQLYERCLSGSASQQCIAFNELAHGVALYQPADLYQQLERSAKYGFLFIFLTFAAFFLHELLKRLAIHPIQYGLVGFALATFFLLVTSLGERIGFASAYGIASAASIGLVGFYLCHVLRSLPRGLAFAGLLSSLYGLLFLLVEAEENALLAGSLALFALIALVMVATRKVDWYALEPRLLPKAPSSETSS